MILIRFRFQIWELRGDFYVVCGRCGWVGGLTCRSGISHDVHLHVMSASLESCGRDD